MKKSIHALIKLEAEASGTKNRPGVWSAMHHCSAHPTDGANPHPPLPVYLAEVMAFICVLDQHSFHFFFFKQGHHLPPATIPVKESILQMLARLQDELSDQENKNKHILSSNLHLSFLR